MNRHVTSPVWTAGLAALTLVAAGCAEEDPVGADGEESPTQESTVAPDQSPTGWTPVPVGTDDSLPSGRLGMTANGRPDAPWAVVEVPEGFTTIDGWVLFDENPGSGGGAVSYWTVSEVVRHPCSGLHPRPLEVGSTAEELAATFDDQRLTRVTEPTPVTVDGYEGLSVELHLPRGFDPASCPEYMIWESDPAGARHMDQRGQFDRLWILDVDGDVVVLAVTGNPDVPGPALDRLTEMVESVDFVPRS